MSRRGAFDEGHGNERFTIDNIMSEKEQGIARAQILWKQVTDLFGGEQGMRDAVTSGAWQEAAAMRDQPGGEDLVFKSQDEDYDYPVIHIQGSGRSKGLEFRYPLGGVYMDVHRAGSDDAVDTIHMGDDKAARRNPRFIRQQAEEYEPFDYE